MRETVFHKELAAALRAHDWWVYKVPDLPAGQMSPDAQGGLRFNLPKPCDLLAADEQGFFVAIECKMERTKVFTFKEREEKQRKTLLDIVSIRHAARAYFAVNFRFEQKKLGRVNRAFLFPVIEINHSTKIFLDDLHPESQAAGRRLLKTDWFFELQRVTGGWKIPSEF